MIKPSMRAAAIIAFVCCCLGGSSAWAIDCMSAAGNPKDGWYAWREIDGRKCWFLKKDAMPAKSQLHWPAKAEQEPRSKDASSQRANDAAPQERTIQEPTEPVAVTPAQAAAASAPQPNQPPRFKLVRVRPTTGASPQLGNILMMNGASLSAAQPVGAARKPTGQTPTAPTDSFNARFIGGSH